MNLNLKFRLSKGRGSKEALAHTGPVLVAWFAVLIVVGVCGWMMYRVVTLTLDASFADPGAKPPQPVLVNTQGFKQALERTEMARERVPDPRPVPDPFEAPDVEAQAQR